MSYTSSEKEEEMRRARAKRKVPVVLTREETRKLKEEPKLEERHYKEELRKRRSGGSRWLTRIKNKIFNAKRNDAILKLFYSSGIRIAELINLDLEDLNLEESQIKVLGKGGKEAYCPITSEAAKALSAYLKVRNTRLNPSNNALFIAKTVGRVSKRDIQRFIPRYARQAGIKKKVTPHTLRHSIATHLLDQGMDLRYVQAFLRHASISSTQIYTHVSNKRLREELAYRHPDNL